MINIEDLNRLPRESAIEELIRCCGARKWAEGVADSRPFADKKELYERAESLWMGLDSAEWKEAFKHHPRIGTADDLRKKYRNTADWAKQEQSGVVDADEEVLAALTSENIDYEKRFGFVFLICATGKSAKEMLLALRSRIGNSTDTEIANAAAEQSKITRIRLEKLIS